MSTSPRNNNSRYVDMTGQKFHRLTFVQFVGTAPDRCALWVLQCECGNELVARMRNVKTGGTRSCGCLMNEHDNGGAARRAQNQSPSYAVVHSRLRRDQGSASMHECIDCGGEGMDWSLRHDAANVYVRDVPLPGQARRWSANPDDYEPRCRPCHRKYDNQEATS